MDAETVTWLLSDEGRALLTLAEQAYADTGGDPVRAAAALRKVTPDYGSAELTAQRTSAALSQIQLRMKAVAKFGGDALQMFFTPDALEQATRARVSAHRAARIAAASPASVADLGCGIGGDLIALSRAGLVAAGVDLDPVRVAMAQANLDALGLSGATTVADVTSIDLSPFDIVFLDPARRTGRGRTFNTADWTPPWEFVTHQLNHRPSVVKVAPGIDHALIEPQVEAEWVSEHGEVKEAVLWSTHLATTSRRATVLGQGGLATLSTDDDPFDGLPRPVRGLGPYLYEPDGAVIRAGLVTAVAAGVDGGLLDEHIAWVTSDNAFSTPFARGYRVIEQLPFREKQLRLALQQRNVGAITIKTRGVDVVPEDLRKRLRLRGDVPATVVLTRLAGAGVAVLVQPF